MAFPFPNVKSADLESGSSQYFTAADSTSLSITGDLTIECDVNLESQPATGTTRFFVSKWDGTNNSYFFGYREDGGGGVYYLYAGVNDSGGTSSTCQKAQTLTAGVWYHIAMIYDASAGEIDLLVNGSSLGVSGSQRTDIKDTTALLAIGALAVPSNYYDGLISDVRIWNTERTPTEINANKAKRILAYQGLKASWTLDDTVNDSSGNGNTLTNVNTIPFVTTIPTLTSCLSREAFLASTTWTVPAQVSSVQALVVAGGGGGGMNMGGGGGAGGLVYNATFGTTPAAGLTVTIGGGGAGATAENAKGVSGDNSVFSSITATGGGGGGSTNSKDGANGGSGGGGAGDGTPGTYGTGSQGNNGGVATGTSQNGGGGGGGFDAVGGNGGSGATHNGGTGGAGHDYSAIFGTDYGVTGVVAGGGGGGAYTTSYAGGNGGAGGGGTGKGSGTGTAGTANTGGGGGAGCGTGGAQTGLAGGSGLVLLLWETSSTSYPPYTIEGFAMSDIASIDGSSPSVITSIA